MPKLTLHRGSFPELESRLIDLVTAEKAADPLRPVVILAGSNLLRTYLLRNLGTVMSAASAPGPRGLTPGRGAIGVTILTFRDLASRLAATGTGAPPLVTTSLLEQVLIRKHLRVAAPGDDLDGAGLTPGFASALHSSLATLDEACLPDLKAELSNTRSGPKSRLLSAHQSRLSAAIGGHLTVPGMLRTAAGMAHTFKEAFDASRLTVYGLYDLTEAQRRLIEALVTDVDCDYLLPTAVLPELASDIQDYLSPLVGFLTGLGFDTSAPRPPAPTSAVGQSTDTAAPRIGLLQAADPEYECIEIVRRIRRLIADGTPPSDIAVALRHRHPYMAIIVERLRDAGVPFRAEESQSAAATTIGRAATLLLSFANGRIPRAALLDYAEERCVPSAGWDSLTRNAMITEWDSAAWKPLKDLLNKTAYRLQRTQETLLSPPDESERLRLRERLDRLETDTSRLQALLRFWNDTDDTVQKLRTETSWAGIAGRLRKALLDSGPSTPAEKSFDESLKALAGLDGYGLGCDTSEFASALQTALDSALLSEGRFMEGVTIGVIDRLRGMSFSHVFVPGVIEGEFPAPARQDPLLLDADRLRLNQEYSAPDARTSDVWPLPLASRRCAEEALLFDIAVAMGRDCTTLLHSKMELASTRECRRSYFLDSLPGYGIFTKEPDETLSAMIPSDAADAVLPSERSLARAATIAPADTTVTFDDIARFSPAARSGLAAVAARSSRSLTEYEGYVGTALDSVSLRSAIDMDSMSATSLEVYAGCPMRFMFTRILGLAAVDRPEELEAHDARTLGTAVHSAFKRFYETIRSEPARYPLDPASLTEEEDLLRRILAEKFAAMEANDFTGYASVWDLSRQRVTESCVTLLRADALLQAETHMRPVLLEHVLPEDFGIDLGGGSRLRITGRIDRVDLPEGAAEGLPPSSVRVVDYKATVGRKGYVLCGGTDLQPALYLLATLEELGAKVEGSEARYAGYGSSSPYRFSENGPKNPIDGLVSQVPGIVESIARSLRAGVFVPNASDRNQVRGSKCSLCDLIGACSANEEDPMAVKSEDPVLESFQSLKEAR